MKCAIIEYNDYHQETISTLVYILNKIGIEVDIYISRKSMKKNSLIYCSGLNYRIINSIRHRFGILESTKKLKDYEFIIVNSIEPKNILTKTNKLKMPLIAVIHNGDLVGQDPDYKNFFIEEKNRKGITLSKFVSEYIHLSSGIETRWISPVFLGHMPYKPKIRTTLCVQGNIEFTRRNYYSLIEAVNLLAAEGIKELSILFVGNNKTPDGKKLKKEIISRSLSAFFRFSDSNIPYKVFFDILSESSFILPLIDKSFPNHKAYFSHKITSSISISIGLAIIPIIHKELAFLYNIEKASYLYQDGELSGVIKKAISDSEKSVEQKRLRLIEMRKALLDSSIKNLYVTLQELDVI